MNKLAAGAWIVGLLVLAALQGLATTDPALPPSMLVAMWAGATFASIVIAAIPAAIVLGVRRLRKRSISFRRALATYTVVWFIIAFLSFASWLNTLNLTPTNG